MGGRRIATPEYRNFDFDSGLSVHPVLLRVLKGMDFRNHRLAYSFLAGMNVAVYFLPTMRDFLGG